MHAATASGSAAVPGDLTCMRGQAIGGIKCNGEGAQGQKLPNIMKALTPPKNGGKIVREKVNPVMRGGISPEED